MISMTDGAGAGQSHVQPTFLFPAALQGPGCSQTGPLEVRTGISVNGSGDVPAGSLEKAPWVLEL